MSWTCVLIIVCYLILNVIYSQSFKILTKDIINESALISLLDFLAGIFAILLIPFFTFKYPTNKITFLLLTLSCIFYAFSERFATTAIRGLEASEFSILKQLSTVFMIFASFLFFKEPFVLTKFIGALLIVISNLILIYQKGKFTLNKYTIFGLLSSLCTTLALFIDVNNSSKFNLPLYIGFTLCVPSILIFLFNHLNFKDIKREYKNANKKYILAAVIASGIMYILKYTAYNIGDIIIVAPLCSLTIILNAFFELFFLKRKDKIFKKIISSLIIILAIILIKL